MTWREGDIEGVIVRRVKPFTDSRGWLAEVFRSDEIDLDAMPAMSYVSVTHAGVSRGPHEHRTQADMFAFFGPGTFRVRMWDHRTDSSTRGHMLTITVGQDDPAVVIVPPRVVHGYTNISDADAWVMNFPNRLYGGADRQEPVDEVRYEDVENCEYEMPTRKENA